MLPSLGTDERRWKGREGRNKIWTWKSRVCITLTNDLANALVSLKKSTWFILTPLPIILFPFTYHSFFLIHLHHQDIFASEVHVNNFTQIYKYRFQWKEYTSKKYLESDKSFYTVYTVLIGLNFICSVKAFLASMKIRRKFLGKIVRAFVFQSGYVSGRDWICFAHPICCGILWAIWILQKLIIPLWF